MSYWEWNGITLEAQLVWALSIAQAGLLPSESTTGACLVHGFLQGRCVELLASSPSPKRKNLALGLTFWPAALQALSCYSQCVCVYTGEIWTQIKTKAETNHSVILSTVIPIRLSQLTHNYVYIFCSIWDNFISKPFLLLSVLAVQSSKILSHWKWSEENIFLDMNSTGRWCDQVAVCSINHAPVLKERKLDTAHNSHGKFWCKKLGMYGEGPPWWRWWRRHQRQRPQQCTQWS